MEHQTIETYHKIHPFKNAFYDLTFSAETLKQEKNVSAQK